MKTVLSLLSGPFSQSTLRDNRSISAVSALIFSASSSIPFLRFSMRQHKMTHTDWCFVRRELQQNRAVKAVRQNHVCVSSLCFSIPCLLYVFSVFRPTGLSKQCPNRLYTVYNPTPPLRPSHSSTFYTSTDSQMDFFSKCRISMVGSCNN